MNKIKKLILTLTGAGIVMAAGNTAIPSDISTESVATAYNASKQVKGKYRLENAKMVREAKANPKDRLEIEIGDDGKNFKPKVKVERWEDEVNFSLELLDGEKGNTKLETENDKIKWSKGNKTARFYEIDPSEQYPEGAFEFDIELKKKPKTNKIEFSLNTKGLDFFYQPELTQQEIDEGAIRPENVVGSYAVYASEQKTNWKGGKEYKTGKVGHIYRPKIYDATGKECWGSLSVDKEAGKLSVEIPQEFLDKAVYPVVVDPTFGYTTVGGTEGTFAVNNLRCATKYAPASDGTISDIYIYTRTNGAVTCSVRGVLYKNSDNSRITYGEEVQFKEIFGENWLNLDVTDTAITSGTDYNIGIWQNEPKTYGMIFFYDTVSGFNIIRDNTAYHATNAPPATYTVNSTLSNRKLSIYATYTAGGGETSRRIIITQ